MRNSQAVGQREGRATLSGGPCTISMRLTCVSSLLLLVAKMHSQQGPLPVKATPVSMRIPVNAAGLVRMPGACTGRHRIIGMQSTQALLLAERLISGTQASSSRPSTGHIVRQIRSRSATSDALYARHPIAADWHGPRTLVQPCCAPRSDSRNGIHIRPGCQRSGSTPATVPSPFRCVGDHTFQRRWRPRHRVVRPADTAQPLCRQLDATARHPARSPALAAAHGAVQHPPDPCASKRQRRHTQLSTRRCVLSCQSALYVQQPNYVDVGRYCDAALIRRCADRAAATALAPAGELVGLQPEEWTDFVAFFRGASGYVQVLVSVRQQNIVGCSA